MFLKSLIQVVGISIGLSLLINYSDDFWLRVMGLFILIVCLDWRYIYDREIHTR